MRCSPSGDRKSPILECTRWFAAPAGGGGKGMSIKKVCDGCLAESPDDSGLHQANHWIDVSLKWSVRFGEHKEQLLLCRPCAKRAADALGIEHLIREAAV